MSDEPNERAARLAGRWGGESDEDAEGDGVEGQERGDEVTGAGQEEATDLDQSAGQDDVRGDEDGVDSKVEDDGEGDHFDGADQVDGRDDDGRESGDGSPLTTREMQSQMLYLPPEFHKEIDLTFEELNLRFRRERDRKLEKNKDFYAGLLRLGLERLGDVRDRELDEVEELLDL